MGDADYPTRWRPNKAQSSRGRPPGQRRSSDLTRGERALWQRRFWEHHVRGPQDAAACIRYCHLNPVKHGLAETPEAWPFSTVHWVVPQATSA